MCPLRKALTAKRSGLPHRSEEPPDGMAKFGGALLKSTVAHTHTASHFGHAGRSFCRSPQDVGHELPRESSS